MSEPVMQMNTDALDAQALVERVREWARELGFSQIGVSGVDLREAEPGLLAWLEQGFHGSMGYMATHGLKRARPAELVPGTVSVITARMDYLPRPLPGGAADAPPADGCAPSQGSVAGQPEASSWQAVEWRRLGDPRHAHVSLYARGRDYHKVLRARLQRLAERMALHIGAFGHRAFTDSAPVLEVELASRSGLGWRGKHTLTLHRDAGSMFFLGEIYVDIALPPSEPATAHCGSCTACLDACPTRAIVAPYRLDARRCISYLTIESDDPIPLDLRPLMGNRIYGCDDCQLACPWNKYAQRATLPDFDERDGLADATLLSLWDWSEDEFLRRTEGSPMRRIGWRRWRRNLAVALGNALRAAPSDDIRQALLARREAADELVREHIDWALAQAPGA